MANQSPYKQLLEFWSPPKYNNDNDSLSGPIPISFISTSFTFDSEFFDEECLTRFLSMETEKENDGVAFLIEREEKLASLKGGIVLIDQNNCKGDRSLRWDLVPCRVNNGIMHAKITILHWSNCIRVIIGSANLTKNGYCINQEGFGVIDYYPKCESDLKVIIEVLFFLKSMVDEFCGSVVKKRFVGLQSDINKYLRKWNIEEKNYKRDELFFKTLFVSPKTIDALTELRKIWDSRYSSPPDQAFITSPFFDEKETINTPSLKIFGILRQKGGNVNVQYYVTTETISDSELTINVNAPDFLNQSIKPDTQFISFYEVKELGENEEGKVVPRPLHFKSIWLSNDENHLYLIGSSNFTSPALGLSKRINYEANLVYGVSELYNPRLSKELDSSHVKGELLDSTLLKFRSRKNEDEEDADLEFLQLPACFGEAVIKKVENDYFLELNLSCSKLPAEFTVCFNEDQSKGKVNIIYSDIEWRQEGEPSKKTIKLSINYIPDSLIVFWKDSGGKAFWPVVLDSQTTLPTVEQLRNLPLEALMQILSSTQPLHRLLKIIERFKPKDHTSHIDETIIDPHKLVETSGYLLQRTRRISYAMVSLRYRLEKPVFTVESLNWRLYGPIGVSSLIDAIIKEAKTQEEKQFLLAELSLELSRIQPIFLENSLPKKEIITAIKAIIEKLATNHEEVITDTSIHNYSGKAFQKALDDL